jgi:hypothetical protein
MKANDPNVATLAWRKAQFEENLRLTYSFRDHPAIEALTACPYFRRAYGQLLRKALWMDHNEFVAEFYWLWGWTPQTSWIAELMEAGLIHEGTSIADAVLLAVK